MVFGGAVQQAQWCPQSAVDDDTRIPCKSSDVSDGHLPKVCARLLAPSKRMSLTVVMVGHDPNTPPPGTMIPRCERATSQQVVCSQGDTAQAVLRTTKVECF